MRWAQIRHSLGWRWRARRFRRAPALPAILLYHSIGPRARDPLLLAVEPDNFRAHMRWLARSTQPLPLDDFVDRLSVGRLPRDAVAVTFDDGYADNFTTAASILAEWGIPATVFVVTDYVGETAEPWWEELDVILLESDQLPEAFAWRDFACTVETRRDSARAGWVVLEAPTSARARAFVATSDYVKRLSSADRRAFMQALRHWAGRAPVSRPGRAMATWKHLGAAAAGGRLQIGAHTATHPCLATRPENEQQREIVHGREILTQRLGRPPAGFAYPFGSHTDFTPATRRLVQAAGFRWAVANMPGHLHARNDPFALPRVLVRNVDAATLAAQLGRCAS